MFARFTRRRLALATTLTASALLAWAGCASNSAPFHASSPKKDASAGALAAQSDGAAAKNAPQVTYPQAAKEGQTDDYHGTKVADPYRWLEDPDSAQSKA